MKNKYYFTYGTSESFPYQNGWTLVLANNIREAVTLFDLVHPRKSDFVNCAGIYDETLFANTTIFKNGDNLGAGCHEVIELTVNKTVS